MQKQICTSTALINRSNALIRIKDNLRQNRNSFQTLEQITKIWSCLIFNYDVHTSNELTVC